MSGTRIPRKIELNLAYARRASVWEDTKIILRTLFPRLLKRGPHRQVAPGCPQMRSQRALSVLGSARFHEFRTTPTSVGRTTPDPRSVWKQVSCSEAVNRSP